MPLQGGHGHSEVELHWGTAGCTDGMRAGHSFPLKGFRWQQPFKFVPSSQQLDKVGSSHGGVCTDAIDPTDNCTYLTKCLESPAGLFVVLQGT